MKTQINQSVLRDSNIVLICSLFTECWLTEVGRNGKKEIAVEWSTIDKRLSVKMNRKSSPCSSCCSFYGASQHSFILVFWSIYLLNIFKATRG